MNTAPNEDSLPELEAIKQRQGKKPESWLVDGGYVGHDQIERVSAAVADALADDMATLGHTGS